MDQAPAQPRTAAAPRRAPLADRYLAANLGLWLLTFALTSIRSLGMGTPWPKFLDMGLRRALVCLISAGVCVLIQKALIASRPWLWPRRLALAGGLSLGGVAVWAAVNLTVFQLIARWSPSAAIIGACWCPSSST